MAPSVPTPIGGPARKRCANCANRSPSRFTESKRIWIRSPRLWSACSRSCGGIDDDPLARQEGVPRKGGDLGRKTRRHHAVSPDQADEAEMGVLFHHREPDLQ